MFAAPVYTRNKVAVHDKTLGNQVGFKIFIPGTKAGCKVIKSPGKENFVL